MLFFFNIQILYTSVTSYGVFFLYISIVYVRNAFQRIPDSFFFQQIDLVYICYILWDVFPM